MLPKRQFQERTIAIDNNHIELLRTILELFYLCSLDEQEWRSVIMLLHIYGAPHSDTVSPVAREIFAKLEALVQRMR